MHGWREGRWTEKVRDKEGPWSGRWEALWDSQEGEGGRELGGFWEQRKGFSSAASRLCFTAPSFQRHSASPEPLQHAAALGVFKPSLQRQKMSSSGNCHRELGSVSLSTESSLLSEDPGKSCVPTADTSIGYVRCCNLLLKDSKDSGKPTISGISYGKLGPSG